MVNMLHHINLKHMADLTLAPEYTKLIENTIEQSPEEYKLKATFSPGTTIVNRGSFTGLVHKDIENASVPLCIIKSGRVSVIQNGKAIKYLGPGDTLGTFETAYYLKFGVAKQIGRWTLKADDEVTVEILLDTFWKNAHESVWQGVIDAATSNHEVKPISRLPLLDQFANKFAIPMRDDCAVIFHSHLLESNYDLIKHIGHLVGGHNVFILEKPYSTVPGTFRKIVQTGANTNFVDVEEKMPYGFSVKRSIEYTWHEVVRHVKQHNIKKIVVVSDGVNTLLSIPWDDLHNVEITAVEQTQSGIERTRMLGGMVPPIVNVAESDAKKKEEAVFIGISTVDKIAQLQLLDRKKKFGVIGYGSIGNASVKRLIDLGEDVTVYETNQHVPGKITTVNSLEELVQQTDIIIGTTGTDVLRGTYIERLQGHKTFISASSGNIEFSYLFDLIKHYPTTFEDITQYINDHLKITIMNGGYPINFDRVREWESKEDIALTRTLMYAGFIQALTETHERGRLLSLRSDFEKDIVENWRAQKASV